MKQIGWYAPPDAHVDFKNIPEEERIFTIELVEQEGGIESLKPEYIPYLVPVFINEESK